MISPLLANIALHGMEAALDVRRDPWGRLTSNNAVVRYADDFVVTCTTREEAERASDRLTPWLAERGLALSEEKTRIVTIKDGSDFLGFNIRQYDAPNTKRRGAILLIKPSRASVLTIRQRLRDEWLSLRGHNVQQVLIRLTPIIRGWANYFRIGAASHTFQALDAWMFRREVRYVKRMHPAKPWYWRRSRYWGQLHPRRDDHWVFGDTCQGHGLLKFSWTAIRRHVLVKGTASPDDPALQDYWTSRTKRRALALPPSKRKLAQRRGHGCEVCGEPLLNDEELHIHHQPPRSQGGTDAYDNLTLRHLYCHQQIHARRTKP